MYALDENAACLNRLGFDALDDILLWVIIEGYFQESMQLRITIIQQEKDY